MKVRSAYAQYSQVRSATGLTGAQMARRMLDRRGLHDVRIELTGGQLTDHYDPRSKVLRLSSGVANGSSLASLGVAAHEAGHALQDEENYSFLWLRSTLVPAANIGSRLAWPLFLFGLIAAWDPLMLIGIAFYVLAVLFTLITLPVEFNASHRALTALETLGDLPRSEIAGARKVLSAAALTYVAAAFTAIVQLLRLIALRGRRQD